MKTIITYKSVLNNLTLKNRNKAFNKLNDKTQRLEIAWDALNLVLNGSIKPNTNTYWSKDLKNIKGDSKMLQKTLNSKKFYKENSCEVCQRGLMMVSQIRLGNSIDSEDIYKNDGHKNNIKGFSIKSFTKMEEEYENCNFNHPYFDKTKEKLANICCNIIVNGDFNIKDRTDYLLSK